MELFFLYHKTSVRIKAISVERRLENREEIPKDSVVNSTTVQERLSISTLIHVLGRRA